MLKFQDDYTTLIATFEDFILLVYTIIDDLYQQFVPASVSQRLYRGSPFRWHAQERDMPDVIEAFKL